ncbi:CpsD/CapB family tyrosine-protein kinase [Hankyongella ginsenosidimutans]|uniref:CpsD/CapB family tyrosine-protein kinase n=1 Tax=Hankyongella ginsenosidimutans TaxID=1763828 RepID=A0A4D7CC24_9SPHN|nr:hypothetical protein [Hankyongella ginsenosidimutans]QCI79572.1 CpsD/CapB family tyrosine-protein kinase [Hankyongella ginsenosidimutans]
MSDLLAGARSRYAYVILDCPPVLPIVDPLVLARKVDSVVFSIRWELTPAMPPWRHCASCARRRPAWRALFSTSSISSAWRATASHMATKTIIQAAIRNITPTAGAKTHDATALLTRR